MRAKTLVLPLALAFAVLASSGAARADLPAKPNIVLIMMDDK